MKIVGLITEYNPFHNGHRYHIEKAKEITGADAAIAVMSGNFVQRGAPAIFPKHLRAQAALESGVSLVLELPVYFAAGSAEYFAAGAVALLDSLGCVDFLCFGSESGDIDAIQKTAAFLCREPENYRRLLKAALKSGASFPKARQEALAACLPDNACRSLAEYPNNILGVEYCKALRKQKSPVVPCTIRRMESSYHQEELAASLSSATAIRKALETGGLSSLAGQLPGTALRLLDNALGKRGPVCADDFSLLLKYKLLTETAASLKSYLDMTEELANRILNCRNGFTSFSRFCGLLKTKDMTYARLSRCLIHLLLGLTREDMENFRQQGLCQYARVLGFRKDSAALLSHIKRYAKVPLITRVSRTEALSGAGLSMFAGDIFAADLYESVVTEKYGLPFRSEYQQPVVLTD